MQFEDKIWHQALTQVWQALDKFFSYQGEPKLEVLVYLGIYYSRTPKRVWYSGSPSAMATPRGLEPPTSSVTGWHSTLLNYGAIYKKGIGAPTLYKVFVFP